MYIAYTFEIILKQPSGSKVLRSYGMSNVPPLYAVDTPMTIDGRLLKVISSHVCIEEIDGVDDVERVTHQIVVE